jgi:hypothetical protein
MTQGDLQKVLRQADPAAVLVSARILERVIREDCQLPNMHWNVPHAKSYVCDRQLLFRHAEQADLDVDSDQLLPDTVILLVRPDQEELSNLESKRLLLKYWRRLFHARVHLALGTMCGDGNLADQAVRERVEVIGRTEFEEVRDVLTQDDWLPPNAGDRETYVEFAAVYLELRQFLPSLLTNYFPGIRDFGKVEALLARDVDAPALFSQTRLAGAGDPVQPVDVRGDESQELYWKIVRQAQGAADEGNLVGAAILRMRASRVAPAAQTLPTRQEAEKDIAQLAGRLADALELTEAETADWARHLTLLLDKADQGARPMEARVLEDLLKVCEDHEKGIYTLDVAEYFLSGGKRPIKRPLPSQRLVRIAKHLRAAIAKLGPVRLSETDRNHLTRLMQQAITKTEESLRSRFRPVLVTALDDVGLKPGGPLEEAAFDKMVAELLDRISTYGYLTFAELRDTISRNQVKLPDLREPEDFIKGDPLIRLDRRLASLLDGVYRPGEFYVRWLERFTSLKFGTGLGRWVTRFVTGPFLLAWLVLLVLGLLAEELYTHVWPREPVVGKAARVLEGPAVHGINEEDTLLDQPLWVWHVGLLLAGGLFSLAMMQSRRFRHRVLKALRLLGRGVKWVLWDVPLKFVPLETMRRLVNSWLFQLVYWYVLKPAVIAALIVLLVERVRQSTGWIIATFVIVSFMVNSRIGRSVSEAVADAFANLFHLVRGGLLPGLLRLIYFVFKQVIEAIEYTLFLVDEWLRYRSGDGQASLVIRTIASVVWAPISFVARFFLVVLIEPGYNPLKAPVSYLAAKVMLPLTGMLLTQAWALIEPGNSFPRYLLYGLLSLTIIHLCDVFGFLFWEMKENWWLYRANRGVAPRPAVIGGHGETIRGLLQPGFHSGTVPRLYARLRTAERAALHSRDWNKVHAYRDEIEEVAHLVQQFFEREMLLILLRSRAWQGKTVTVSHAYLSTNRIRVELGHADHPAAPVEVEIEHHDGWLLAGIASTGWLSALTREQLVVFEACLAYVYKRSDVDLVREQIQGLLPTPPASIQVIDDTLVVRSARDVDPTRFPLTRDSYALAPGNGPDGLIFARSTLTWKQWDAAWARDHAGEGHPGLPGVADALVRLPPPAPGAAQDHERKTDPFLPVVPAVPGPVEEPTV